MKTCTKCKIEKELNKFRINRNECKSCNKEYDKQRYLNNIDHIKETNKIWRLNNINHKKEYDKQWRLQNIDHITENKKQYQNKKYKTDPEYRAIVNCRNRINKVLKSQKVLKSIHTLDLIGCSIQELKEYLEKQFKEGMSWDKRESFHIDHIIPCSSFNLLDIEEQKKCFHYTNLQPLYPIENLQKSNKVIE